MPHLKQKLPHSMRAYDTRSPETCDKEKKKNICKYLKRLLLDNDNPDVKRLGVLFKRKVRIIHENSKHYGYQYDERVREQIVQLDQLIRDIKIAIELFSGELKMCPPDDEITITRNILHLTIIGWITILEHNNERRLEGLDIIYKKALDKALILPPPPMNDDDTTTNPLMVQIAQLRELAESLSGIDEKSLLLL